ncbi:Alpha-tocopherol transfer protein-like [Folsomia candida]|uniref:Alpha-tocopherol transfer protein-like n=1 Tax=Folsomia candida TaxID=158441 RepID=A0A226EIH4_FOLCA|nr:Alpha-tocopherol transfer protein-like [Folsomia candida]
MLDATSTKYLHKKAWTELNEREDSSQEVVKFRMLIEKLEGLTCPTDEQFLIRFLRAKKFHRDEAMKLLISYYEMRRDNPSLFRNLNPEYLRPSLEKRLQHVLSSRDDKGRQVFIFRAGSWNPNEVSLDNIFRCNYLYLEEMTSLPETQINGISAVVDFHGFSFFQARHFTPKHALRMIKIIQGSFPCRFQEFHLVNQPYIFHLVYSIVKPFLSEKIRDRIHVHGTDLNSLHRFLRPEILPEFLGGSNNNSWDADWLVFMKRMLDKNQHYKGNGKQ